MTTPYEFASKFPLTILVYVFSAGLLFITFFPIDIMSFNILKGWSVPSIDALSNIVVPLENSYRPFVLLQYFSDFPNGLVKLVLFSIVPGVFLFLLQDVFMWINHNIMGGKVKNFLKSKRQYEDFSAKDLDESIKFTKWLKENGYFNYADTLSALKYIPSCCLYVFQIFTALSSALFVAALFFNYFSLKFIIWILFYGLFGMATYLVDLASNSFVNKKFLALHKTFKKKYQVTIDCV